MLQGPFYTIDNFSKEGESVMATIALNNNHDIFRGHFPGHPVVPGVCMMQIVRELMEKASGKRMRIAVGENMKFLSIINPLENPVVEVAINFSAEPDLFKINATLFAGPVTFFKFKGGFKPL